jgi:hypothetical protein
LFKAFFHEKNLKAWRASPTTDSRTFSGLPGKLSVDDFKPHGNVLVIAARIRAEGTISQQCHLALFQKIYAAGSLLFHIINHFKYDTNFI